MIIFSFIIPVFFRGFNHRKQGPPVGANREISTEIKNSSLMDAVFWSGCSCCQDKGQHYQQGTGKFAEVVIYLQALPGKQHIKSCTYQENKRSILEKIEKKLTHIPPEDFINYSVILIKRLYLEGFPLLFQTGCPFGRNRLFQAAAGIQFKAFGNYD